MHRAGRLAPQSCIHSALCLAWFLDVPTLSSFMITIKDMLALQELKLYYKLTHNELPAYFQNWQIVTNSEIHRHNTRRKHDIHIVGFRHTFAKRCIRINMPQTVNNTTESVKDKLFTHSFRGFVNFAKLTFLQNYKNECTVVNCYICDRVQH